MRKSYWFNPSLWSVLTISVLFSGCAGRNISFLVTRPAEINLSEYDKITIGEIKGSGSGFVSKLSDLGILLQGVESKDTWVRKLSAEIAQAIAHSGRFELLDYENLKTGRSAEVDIGGTVLISGGILAYDYDEEETGDDADKTEKRQTRKPVARNTP